MTIKIDHLAIVVDDMENALKFWHDALGLPLGGTEEVAAEAVEVAFLPVGESKIELLRPTTDGSGVAKYLAKRGAGMHHVCLAVENVQAALDELSGHGIELINAEPRQREDGTLYAFVHPKSTGGVLVELYQQG